MSIRTKVLTTFALMLVALCGATSTVNAADTEPVVRETCTQAARVEYRAAGHPGKSVRLPKRQTLAVAPCKASKPMMLASYTDARGGRALVKGQTEQALEQLAAIESRPYSILELNNQCVAHTVLRQWAEASDACDAAVAGALGKRKGPRKAFGAPDYSSSKTPATAYSNRAVMYWLSNDPVAAHNDLAKARKLAPHAGYVLRNLNVAAPAASLALAEVNRASIE
jgi:hypothetical protein